MPSDGIRGTPAVILALASSTGATGTPSEAIRRWDSSEAVAFQPNSRPCIDLPAGIAREDGSLNKGWSLAIQSAHDDEHVMTWALNPHYLEIYTLVGPPLPTTRSSSTPMETCRSEIDHPLVVLRTFRPSWATLILVQAMVMSGLRTFLSSPITMSRQ
jgi:hypothetical protein